MINKNKTGSVNYPNVFEYLSNFLNFCRFINTDLEGKTRLAKSRVICRDNVEFFCERKSCNNVQ
jgi:hypothetical protein